MKYHSFTIYFLSTCLFTDWVHLSPSQYTEIVESSRETLHALSLCFSITKNCWPIFLKDNGDQSTKWKWQVTRSFGVILQWCSPSVLYLWIPLSSKYCDVLGKMCELPQQVVNDGEIDYIFILMFIFFFCRRQ